MKIGILGAGKIANTVSNTLVKMKEIEIVAVASRDLDRAKEFADKFGIKRAYGCYDELYNDKDVELIYICTTIAQHFEQIKACIEHKKHVLCEKAFTYTAEEAKIIKRLSEENNIYVAEAIWTRYMPSRKIINDVISGKPVGETVMATANLGYDVDGNDRLTNPDLGGGVLLDIGIYGLNFIIMHFGKDFYSIDSSCILTPTGVDGNESITFKYRDGKMGVCSHSMYGRSDRKGIFYCENGYIVVENINNPRAINVFNTKDELVSHYDVPAQISGYEYQFTEAIKCIAEGRNESYSMPLSETVYMMEIMDGLRQQFSKK